MSLPSTTTIAATHAQLMWRRHYGGPMTTLALAGHPAVHLTPGHSVLTHAGWRRADLVVPGVHLVVADSPGVGVDVAYEHARQLHSSYRLPTDAADFRGDGDRHDSHVVCLDESAWPPRRPWVGNEGIDPDVDRAAVRATLDALCTTAEFGVLTWFEACQRVPGLADAYPRGPVGRYGPIGDAARLRLGAAVAALPEAPLDRAALGRRLLGAATALRLVEVLAVDTGVSAGTVYDVTAAGAVMLAGAVVVAA